MTSLLLTWSSAALADKMHVASVYTSQPIGHYEFCKRSPYECRPQNPVKPRWVVEDDWSLMMDINLEVNHKIRQVPDKGRDTWSYPTTVGDCEDFVLLKRRRMIEEGFDPSMLLITAVILPDGRPHAVLTVVGAGDDWILDSLTDEVLPYGMVDYTFVKRQARDNAGRWVNILPAGATSSVR